MIGHARTVILFLVLGALTNIAVVWGSSVFPRSPWEICDDVESQDWPVSVPSKWPKQARAGVGFQGISTWHSYIAEHEIDSQGSEPGAFEALQVGIFTFGWPARSLVFEGWEEILFQPATGPTYVTDGHPTGAWRIGWNTPIGQKRLPVRPIWPGFAINTLFYAAIFWLLFAAPFALRKWRRVKKGLCPACAYPVGESDVCTECGKPVKKASTHQGIEASRT